MKRFQIPVDSYPLTYPTIGKTGNCQWKTGYKQRKINWVHDESVGVLAKYI